MMVSLASAAIAVVVPYFGYQALLDSKLVFEPCYKRL
jgi:hypothetical protein